MDDASAGADAADLLVIAGGGARRLGGVDKALLRRGDGRTVLAALLAAPVAGRRIVVGPRRSVDGVDVWTREDPPGGGPVAALAAGLAAVRAEVVVVLAGDLPHGADAVAALLAALPGHDAAVVEHAGRPQWLLAAWRRDALAAALTGLGDPAGARMSALYDGVPRASVPDPAQWSGDLDTPPTSDASTTPDAAPMTSWLVEARAALDLPDEIPVQLLLDLARDAAHGVARPAAPLTTFLAGLAAGRAGGTAADVDRAVATLTARLGDRT